MSGFTCLASPVVAMAGFAYVSYQLLPSLQLALQINNLSNAMPQRDGSYPGSPDVIQGLNGYRC